MERCALLAPQMRRAGVGDGALRAPRPVS